MLLHLRTVLITTLAATLTHHTQAAPVEGVGGPGQGDQSGWTKTVNTLVPDLPQNVLDSCDAHDQGLAMARSNVARTWGGGYATEFGFHCHLHLENDANATHSETWVFTPDAPGQQGMAKASAFANGTARALALDHGWGESAAVVGGYARITCNVMPTLNFKLVAFASSSANLLTNTTLPVPGGTDVDLTTGYGSESNYNSERASVTWSAANESSQNFVDTNTVTAMSRTGMLVEVYADGGSSEATYEATASLTVTLSRR